MEVDPTREAFVVRMLDGAKGVRAFRALTKVVVEDGSGNITEQYNEQIIQIGEDLFRQRVWTTGQRRERLRYGGVTYVRTGKDDEWVAEESVAQIVAVPRAFIEPVPSDEMNYVEVYGQALAIPVDAQVERVWTQGRLDFRLFGGRRYALSESDNTISLLRELGTIVPQSESPQAAIRQLVDAIPDSVEQSVALSLGAEDNYLHRLDVTSSFYRDKKLIEVEHVTAEFGDFNESLEFPGPMPDQ